MPVAQVALHVVRILGYFRGGLFQMTNVKNTKNPLKQGGGCSEGGAVPVELYGIEIVHPPMNKMKYILSR